MVKSVRYLMVFVVIAVVASLSPPASARDQAPFVDDNNPFEPVMETVFVDEHEVGCDPLRSEGPVLVSLCPDLTVTAQEAAVSPASFQNLQSTGQTVAAADIPRRIVFQDGFESLSLWGGRSPSSRNKVKLTRAGFEGAGLHVAIPRGSHFGADFRLDLDKTLGEDPEDLFFRYYLRFDPDWAPDSAGKLPGFSGVYSSTGLGGFPSQPYAPGWSSRMEFFPTRKDPRAALGYYVYHLGQRERYGDSMRWNEAGKLIPGEWYCLEGEIQLNSLGRANGKLRSWVDGNPAFDLAGLQFRRPNEPDIRIESFWFNVYYGGKTVPDRDLGLTIDSVVVSSDRVGCGIGSGIDRSVEGDLDGDGLADQLTWSTCPDGACFELRTTPGSKARSTTPVGDRAWFSLQTQRFGMASGDLDGDGRDELIYRGRCDGSEKCWRVHNLIGSTLGAGRDWGGAARFAPSAATMVLGDWDGDGLDDLAYQGKCKASDFGCWRVHRSTGYGFADSETWGAALAESLLPTAADVTGDGYDDLVYTAACGKTTCWYVQPSSGAEFGEATILGEAQQHELEDTNLFDFDGDGLADLVSVRRHKKASRIEVRLMQDEGLASPVSAAVLDGKQAEIQLRRVGTDGPAEAIVRLDCRSGTRCVQHLAAWSMKLVPVSEYRLLLANAGEPKVE